jgi:cytochrome c
MAKTAQRRAAGALVRKLPYSFNLEPMPKGWLEVNRKTAVALLVASWLVAACSGGSDSASGGADDAAAALTAATLGEQSVLAAADYLQQPPYAGADRENGQRLAQMCKACHTLGAGGVHMIGPNLFGFFGRTAGSAERYAYSAALQEAEFAWTPRALDAWLARPARFLPGNRMSFPGVSSASDRADMIAYLLEATSPQDGQ